MYGNDGNFIFERKYFPILNIADKFGNEFKGFEGRDYHYKFRTEQENELKFIMKCSGHNGFHRNAPYIALNNKVMPRKEIKGQYISDII